MVGLILAPSALCFILLIPLSFYVLSKNPKELPNISFAIATGTLALVELGKFMFLLNPVSWTADIWLKCFWGGLVSMPVSWLFFSLIFAREGYNPIITKWRWGLTGVSLASAAAILVVTKDDKAIYPAVVGKTPGVVLGADSYFMCIYLMLAFVLVIVNFENTLRNASGPIKRQIKYAIVGIIGVFSFFIYILTEALLYSFIAVKLLFAGSCITIILTLVLYFSIIRYRMLDVHVFISRYVIYRSVSILAVGIYLLLTGTLLQLTEVLGGSFYQYFKPVMVFVAVALFAILLLSDRVRRKLQIFISKNFFANKYDYRYVWSQFTEKLGYTVKINEMLPEIAEMIAGIMWVESVSIWLYDEEVKGYKVAEYFNLMEMKDVIIKSDDFIVKALEEQEILDLTKLTESSDVQDLDKAIFMSNTLNARVVVSMKNQEGLMGFIAVGSEITGEHFNYEDYELLQTLARQSANLIQNAMLSERLMISQQMESVTRVASFIIHDLKNLISTLDMLLDNSREYIDNPEFQKDLIITLENTVKKMRRMMERVSTKPQETNFIFEPVNLINIIRNSIEEVRLENNPKVKLMKSFDENDSVVTMGDEKSLNKVFTNILINAMQALPSIGGVIDISVNKNNDRINVSISDNGKGITQDFIKKSLFKPFQTTKEGGLGIGLYQCKTIIGAHEKATLDVESEKGKGAKFIISFPISERGAVN
ncbi:MAG: PEP-CTERM system histidine kinase PrsK [Candidatus Schekmanbacteria bacterium]|nr:PEP-CTERM system histidine kinase PrsK [Candidatus Schekmanbacteria bacterium]